MSLKTLHVFFENHLVGRLVADEAHHLSFQYDPQWLNAPQCFPLSITMPCREEPYEYPVPQIFFENLLPEEDIRKAMERAFKVAKEDPYQYLKAFGEDLAGAFTVRATHQPPNASDLAAIVEVPWDYVNQAIDDGRKLYAAITKDFGAKFSLAGAQDKFVVIYDELAEKVFVPQRGAPTTHIMKIDLQFPNSQTVYNEYYCLRLAKSVGLNVVDASIVHKGSHPLLLIKRYDRCEKANDGIHRRHQEDFCQASGKPSSLKYEQKGGPRLVDHYNLIKKHSNRRLKDLDALLNWLCFNIFIGNNDSHGKNLSFLYGDGKVALAPFYDLLSTEVYGGKFDQDFAFGINGKFAYRAWKIADFHHLENELGLRKGKLLSSFATMHARLKKHMIEEAKKLKAIAPASTIGERICELIASRSKHFTKISKLL